MNLAPDWKRLLRYTWSIRLVVLSAALSGCEVILPLFVETMPRNTFAILSMLAAIGAGVARVMAQPKMERRKKSRMNPDYKAADYD